LLLASWTISEIKISPISTKPAFLEQMQQRGRVAGFDFSTNLKSPSPLSLTPCESAASWFWAEVAVGA